LKLRGIVDGRIFTPKCKAPNESMMMLAAQSIIKSIRRNLISSPTFTLRYFTSANNNNNDKNTSLSSLPAEANDKGELLKQQIDSLQNKTANAPPDQQSHEAAQIIEADESGGDCGVCGPTPYDPSNSGAFNSSKQVFQHYTNCFTARKPFISQLTALSSPRYTQTSDNSNTASNNNALNQFDRGNEVFANNDTPLAHIEYYGFDYDYTLAAYNSNVGSMIFESAKKFLVEKLLYPSIILQCTYDESFPIRGLQFDTRSGYLIKLDQFGKIQTHTVHRGKQRVSLDQIIQTYKGVSISKEYEQLYLKMMADLFCLPEACLLADIIQVFVEQTKQDFSPDYLYRDIRQAIDHAHGLLHQAIIAQPQQFLEKNNELGLYLSKLRAANKKIFLLTNSPFKFVDAGMKYMLNEFLQQSNEKRDAKNSTNWLDLFDISIFSARKPHFWVSSNSFRSVDTTTGQLSFRPVSEFKRGAAYTEGGLKEFTRLTKASGSNVLYCGDHITADLVAPSENAMWKTAAIIKEIGKECDLMASELFRNQLRAVLELEALIDYGQRLQDEESRKSIEDLKQRRSILRRNLLRMFNRHYGSVFRTTSHRTKFFFEVSRFADLYTGSVANFLNYPLNYCFYSKRSFFPHEVPYEIITKTSNLNINAANKQ
jgi:HAD superfamily 5'-nucleotidase-like hydrolase